ncbi:hypothetical protein T09_4435 [Trichinella sp. T9]|nr:hypothetical protein T09_4435 [Trichinella sp. T9]
MKFSEDLNTSELMLEGCKSCYHLWNEWTAGLILGLYSTVICQWRGGEHLHHSESVLKMWWVNVPL